jgi:DNA repair exonuclease SbcCD nuclease subunit
MLRDINKALIIGDLHLSLENYEKVLNSLQLILSSEQENFDTVVFLGDVFNSNRIRGTTAIEISEKLKSIIPSEKQYLILTGNHDFYSKDISLSKLFGDSAILHPIIIQDILFLPFEDPIDTDKIAYLYEKYKPHYVFLHYDIFSEHKCLNWIYSEPHIQLIFAGHLHDFKKNKKYIQPGNFYFNNFSDAGKVQAYYVLMDFSTNHYLIKSHTNTPVFLRIVVESPIENLQEFLLKEYPYIQNREWYLRLVLKISDSKKKRVLEQWLKKLYKSFNNIDIQFEFSDTLNSTENKISSHQFDLKNIIQKTLNTIPKSIQYDEKLLKSLIDEYFLSESSAEVNKNSNLQ